MKSYYVYILASRRNGTLYIGVTDNLIKGIKPQGKPWTLFPRQSRGVLTLYYLRSLGNENLSFSFHSLA